MSENKQGWENHDFGFGAGIVPDFLELDYEADAELMQFGGKSSIGAFFRNARKSAGRQISKVEKTIKKANADVSRKLGKIPIVGAPLKAVYDVSYHTMTAPVRATVDIGVHGKRIDRVAMGQLKETVQDVKNVGQYAQTVVSLVPGVGTGVSAALGAGLALANGQPIDKVLLAGVAGACPGGPVAAAALTAGVTIVKGAASGKKIDLKSLGNAVVQGVGQGLGLPPAATQAIGAGVSLAGNLAAGKKLDAALTEAAVSALPVDDKVKQGISAASKLSLDLAHGKRIDKALAARVGDAVKFLPATGVSQEVDALLKNKNLKPEQLSKALATTLHAGVATSLIDVGSKNLSKDAKKALQSGIALGGAMVNQSQQAQAVTKAAGKITEAGLQLSKALPAMGAARALAKGSTKGFDLGAGITANQASLFEIQAARAKLTPADKKGFDMALSARVGLVGQPVNPKATAAAQAGAAITYGMTGNDAANKTALMKVIAKTPSAAVGAKGAVKAVAAARAAEVGFIRRLLRALGLEKAAA